jgi:hypothetical protein
MMNRQQRVEAILEAIAGALEKLSDKFGREGTHLCPAEVLTALGLILTAELLELDNSRQVLRSFCQQLTEAVERELTEPARTLQ